MSAASPLAVIIEDDAAAAEALTLILRDWGADVVHGLTPQSAVETLGPRARGARWIITDFNLGAPGDSISLLPALMSAAPDARVLILSGSLHGRANAEAAAAGFEIMRKPARADAIIAWLERT